MNRLVGKKGRKERGRSQGRGQRRREREFGGGSRQKEWKSNMVSGSHLVGPPESWELKKPADKLVVASNWPRGSVYTTKISKKRKRRIRFCVHLWRNGLRIDR